MAQRRTGDDENSAAEVGPAMGTGPFDELATKGFKKLDVYDAKLKVAV